MTETTEETIARLAKERAKTILENSDYWSGPGPAKTSAEAVSTLIGYEYSLLGRFRMSPPIEVKPASDAESPKPKRQPKESPAPATTEANGEPESADV